MGEPIETPGMTFLRRLDIAKENKTTLFAFLYQTIQKANPSEDSRNLMKKLWTLWPNITEPWPNFRSGAMKMPYSTLKSSCKACGISAKTILTMKR